MSITGVILFIIFGFVIGLLARAIVPGKQDLSLVMTTLLGAAGALIGGFIVKLISGSPAERFEPAGFIGSLICAVVLLGIYVYAIKRRRVAH